MRGEWHHAARIDEIEEDDVIQAKVGDKLLAVYNIDGKFYVTSDICTHAYACLSEGVVIDDIIECPLHQGRFHIPTGKPKGAPVTEPLATYEVKIEDGAVLVRLDD